MYYIKSVMVEEFMEFNCEEKEVKWEQLVSVWFDYKVVKDVSDDVGNLIGEVSGDVFGVLIDLIKKLETLLKWFGKGFGVCFGFVFNLMNYEKYKKQIVFLFVDVVIICCKILS